MNKPIPADALDKTLFGVVPFTDLFDKWIYCRSYIIQNKGSLTRRPKGFVFMSSRYSERVNTWFNDRNMKENLGVLAKEHVKDRVQALCCEGPPVHYEIIPWKDTGHALIMANDRTMIPHIWVAFVPLDSIPEINSTTTPIWDEKGEGYDG